MEVESWSFVSVDNAEAQSCCKLWNRLEGKVTRRHCPQGEKSLSFGYGHLNIKFGTGRQESKESSA